MTRVMSCVNQKGGVGKTTICVNLADALVQRGKRVLLIDMDPQGHMSQCLGVRDKSLPGVHDVLQGEKEIADVYQVISESLLLVPPGEHLIRLESVQMKPGRGLRLRKAMQNLDEDQFDYVIMDCAPSNGFLVVNAIAASQELLVPVTPDYLGLSGLSEIVKQISKYEQVMGKFKHLWVVISRFQKRKVSEEAKEKIHHYFGSRVAKQVIAERAVVAESPGHGIPISKYAPRSKSKQEFNALAEQIDLEN